MKKGFTLIELAIIITIMALLSLSVFYIYQSDIHRKQAIAIANEIKAIDTTMYNIELALYNMNNSLIFATNPTWDWLTNTQNIINWYNQTFNTNDFSNVFPVMITSDKNIQANLINLNQNMTMQYNNKSITLPVYQLKTLQLNIDNQECNIVANLLPNKITCNNNVLTYTLNNGNGYLVGIIQ